MKPFQIVIFLFLTPPLFSEMPVVHRIDVWGSNVFILETDTSLFMIDTGYPMHEVPILETIKTLKKPLKLIILTHAHYDHVGCAARIKASSGALITIHRLDADDLCTGQTQIPNTNFIGLIEKLFLPVFEYIWKPEPICPDILLDDGDLLNDYGLDAYVCHTPGHTAGSISIIVGNYMAFVGDLLTSFPFGKQIYFATDWKQIEESIIRLDQHDFYTIYLGHGDKTYKRENINKIAEGLLQK
jgi:glyoxylase-like metal-dependent hydrolase (beta-lactamase superfamily II)